ncbi:peptidoglycan DD-metalloendopeptidase family protein [Staphylococcus haemolyticus]|uniref:peptidoglycan DD-metalloendopeptidase family protein n=1 Tax=Staphylococcus haemolyticus TaxID=1283 RepID=UPI0011A045CA|nr:peptidoglycan DD-metalloendopeptidase family protein [Staphylococcus haemolyticus]
MADFNLGAEVSMDVDPIKASSRTLERELKNINKSLRSQRSEFKRNELSAEQLADREKNLGKAIKAQEGLLKKRQDSLQDVRTEISKSNVVTEEQKRKLNSASRAVQQAENQLSIYNRELKETELAYKQFNRSSDQVKNSLGELKNRAKLSEIAFKQGTRSVDNYKDHLTEMNYTITKSKANINLLKQNLKEVSLAHGSTSRQADKLRNDILKESVAMQIAQGRADELSDELDEVARSQRKVALAATLMGAGFAGARNSADRIATTLRSLGEITQGVVGEVMATQFANLVPIMGSVVSAGAGIGGMLTSLAGGAIGLGGAFGIGMGAINVFAGQATYALKKLEDGELALTNETRRYQSVLSSLKNEWEGLIAQNQAKIFNTLSNGINIARTSLSNLNPFLTRTAGQIESMSGKMLNWVKTSSNAKTAFNILNTQGTQAFGHLLQGAYHFVDGTTAVFNKLSPLFVWASKGFENMALSFRKWANSVEGSKAINGFVEYTKTNLPIVGRIFGNVFAGLFNLFSAFSGHSHNVLLGIESVTEGFRKWSEELKRSDGFKQFVEYLETNGPKVWQLIKNITGVLWGLVKGMAPVASVTLSVTNAITGWLSSMVNTHPMIGKILGSTVALTGAILLLLKPIFLVKGALSGMRGALLAVTGAEKLLGAQGAFATLGMKRQAIQAKITTAATKVWSVVTKAAALATRGLGLALRFMTGPIGIAITVIGALTTAIIYLWKNNETFRNFVIKAWNSIKNTATSVFGFLKVFIPGSFKFIKDMSIKFLVSLKNGFVTIVKSLVNAGKRNFNILKAFLSVLWSSIKNNTLKIWLLIKTGVLNIIRGLTNGAKKIIGSLKVFITKTFNLIKTTSLRIWLSIKNGTVNAIRSMYNGIKKIITNLKNFMIRSWQFIKNKVVAFAKSLANGVKKNFSNLYNFSKNIFGKLKNFLSNVWKNIRNNTVKLAKSLYSGVRNTFSKLFNFTRSIFSKLRNWMSSIWRKIRNSTVDFARSLYNGVKRNFSNLYNGTRNIFSKTKNFMSNTWRSIKNNTVNMAKSLWNSVRNVFNNMSNGLKNIIGKIKGHITGMVSAVKKSLNALIGAVNWVGGKLGIDSKIPKLSTGTEGASSQSFVSNGAINQPTLATVNDKGRGNGTGVNGHQELIQRSNGSIYAPQGRDVVVPLNKGDRVINGKTTQKLQNQGFIPKFSRGTDSGADVRKRMLRDAKKRKKHNHPTFDAGEMMGQGGFGAGGAGGAAKEAWKYVTDKTKDIGSGAKHTVKSLSDGAKKMINTTKGALGAAGTWAKEKAGDLLDYVGKPGKLVDKVLKEFGVDFSMVNGEIPKMLWDAMWKQLKEGVKSLFGGWLDDVSGGDGDGRFIKYLDNITTRYSPNGPPPGYPFNWAHPGIDLPYIYEKVLTPMGGKVETRHTASGFGKHVIVRAKPYDAYFGHLSKWLVKNGQRVKPGDAIGISGNTGSSSGPHLHYEMNKHGFGSMTGHSIDPVKWLKSHNGSKGGVSKSASAWKPDIRRAAKAIGVRVSNADVNDVARLIQTESSGNAGVTQGIKDVNSGGNEAQGLLQYTPGSFNSYAIRGHKNIKNGYDQLLAFFNNTDWRANLSYWKRRMASGLTGWGPTGRRKKYATGTNNARKGYATVFEKGGEIMNLRGGEQIIPNDVSIAAIERVINSDIFNRTQSAVYEAISRFADGIREEKDKQQQTEMRRNLEYQALKEQNVKLTSLVEKMDAIISTLFNLEDSNERIANKSNVIDRYSLGEEVNTIVDKRERHKNRKARFKPSVT